MWNLTPEYIQQVKDELQGRRDAIHARYADELKSIEVDLEEVETLERIAYAVAVKHLPEPVPAEPVSEIAVLQPEQPEEAPQAMVELQAEPPASEPSAEPGPKGLSRWRMRLEANSEAETA